MFQVNNGGLGGASSHLLLNDSRYFIKFVEQFRVIARDDQPCRALENSKFVVRVLGRLFFRLIRWTRWVLRGYFLDSFRQADSCDR